MVESVVGWLRVTVFITSDPSRISLSRVIDRCCAFFLSCSLDDRSAVTHWTVLPLCLWRIRSWDFNPSLGWSLVLFQWMIGISASSCFSGRDAVAYTVRRGFHDRESSLHSGCWCRLFETRKLSLISQTVKNAWASSFSFFGLIDIILSQKIICFLEL